LNPAISAVVATYNRKALLRQCLDALLNQTRPPDRIIVVDNACTDGTADMLNSDYPTIDVVTLPHNAGSSGGLHAGMSHATQRDCDWLWIMDDDAEPQQDALEQLAKLTDRKDIAALACLKIDAQGNTLHQHRGFFTFNDLPRRIICPITESQLSENQPLEIDHASFVGLMVNTHAIQAVGLPDPRLFLQFDDVEYCIRLRSFGTILLAPHSRIIHKEQTPKGVRHLRLFGQPYQSIPYPDFWKRYFVYRNFLWLSRQHSTSKLKMAVGLPALYTFLVTATLLYETRRFRRILTLTHAFIDGLTGRFDNTKPQRLLYKKTRTNGSPPKDPGTGPGAGTNPGAGGDA
jgi:rhamnopyranosyl-N-acetylglucosaminyl-diphospho-decaprenol beta-1,3/1,4-galactofuranosyltransferase